MPDQPTPATAPTGLAPSRKVTATALGGAMAVLIMWGLQLAGAADPPMGVEGAVAVLASFGASYLTRG